MPDLQNSEFNDGIDLRELLLILWAYKLFIASTCALSIMYAGYYVLNANKEFSSTAIFKLDEGSADRASLNSDLSALTAISGRGINMNDSNLPIDEVTGRIFIENLDDKLNLQADPFFNTYNPNSVDPIWKSLIKRAIGWQKPSTNTQEAVWQSIVATYSKNVLLNKTMEGSVKLSVTHVNPQRAAEIANIIMDEIITNTKMRKDIALDQQLSYLSNTLAKALSDLEVSQSNLKAFALENSALPLESFAEESLKLDALREQFNQTSVLHEAMSALLLMLRTKQQIRRIIWHCANNFPSLIKSGSVGSWDKMKLSAPGAGLRLAL